jgi:hypothetical protein
LQQTVYWGYSVQQKQLTKPQINPLKLHLHAEHEISQLSDFSSPGAVQRAAKTVSRIQSGRVPLRWFSNFKS